MYFSKYFDEHRSNVKKTWDGIHDIINISKKSPTNINKIYDKGNLVQDGISIANSMNNFFVNIGSLVEAKIPKGKKSFSSYFSIFPKWQPTWHSTSFSQYVAGDCITLAMY